MHPRTLRTPLVSILEISAFLSAVFGFCSTCCHHLLVLAFLLPLRHHATWHRASWTLRLVFLRLGLGTSSSLVLLRTSSSFSTSSFAFLTPSIASSVVRRCVVFVRRIYIAVIVVSLSLVIELLVVLFVVYWIKFLLVDALTIAMVATFSFALGPFLHHILPLIRRLFCLVLGDCWSAVLRFGLQG